MGQGALYRRDEESVVASRLGTLENGAGAQLADEDLLSDPLPGLVAEEHAADGSEGPHG